MLEPADSALDAWLITAGAAPLTKQRTISCPEASVALREGRHQLVGRVERQRRQARVALAGRVDVEARLVGEHEQRALGRIAHDLAVDELRVARDDVGQDRVLDRVRRAGGVLDLALELVARARDRVAVGRVDHLDRRHLVHRQRAGLVRVDRRGRTERLDRGEVLEHRAVPGELGGAEREDHLQHRRHRLRNRRDRERDRAREHARSRTGRAARRART